MQEGYLIQFRNKVFETKGTLKYRFRIFVFLNIKNFTNTSLPKKKLFTELASLFKGLK